MVTDINSPDLNATTSSASTTKNSWGLLAAAMFLSALAGAMAWGIRGQYGHELGAMIFGVLVGFTVVMLFLPNASALQAARVVALFTVAIGFGGSMSYGETVGLTHDTGVQGNIGDPHWNAGAYWWGMLGLAIKGGLWIGFGGALLGMAMGARKYRPLEMLGLGLGMLALLALGIWLFNSPFDPENRQLPKIYFSDHWRWEADENVNPRPEVWGGVLLAFIGLLTYLQFVKRDRMARNLACWGLLGGLGFPIGQSLQAANAWDSTTFSANSFWQYGMNSWNMMEVAFGTIAGLAIGTGVWFNRKQIAANNRTDDVSLSTIAESLLIALYVALLLGGWYFGSTILGQFHEFGHLMGIIPMLAIVGGRFSPFIYALPIAAMPIAIKTFRHLSLRMDYLPQTTGAITLVAIPLILLLLVAVYFGIQSKKGARAQPFASIGLLLTSAVYFWLNFAFMSFPWQWWRDWKGYIGQTNSGAIYVIGWIVLTLAAVLFLMTGSGKRPTAEQSM